MHPSRRRLPRLRHLVFLSLIALVPVLSVAPAAATEESERPPAQSSPLTEARALLDEIERLSRQARALKSNFSDIPEVDHVLFISLLVKIEDGIRNRLDRLIELEQALAAEAVSKLNLKQRIRAVIAQQSEALQTEIKGLGRIISALRTSEAEQKGNDRFLQLSIERAEEELDRLITAWHANLERAEAHSMSVAQERNRLDRLLEMRAITLATRIRLDLDTTELLKERYDHATEEDKKAVEQQLNLVEMRKNASARHLEAAIETMNRQGLDTTRFGQLLVIATGEILNENVDTEAVMGLVEAGLSKTVVWLEDNLALIVFRILSSIAILVGFRLLAGVLRRLVERAVVRSGADTSQLLHNFVGSMTSRLVMFVGIVIALSQLGIEIGPLLAGMGILGFVTGFALKDALSNFAAGMMILIYRPFDIGDAVEAGGVLGKVKEMSLVTTTILTFDNQQLIVPNTKIWGNTIRNITSQPYRRVDLSVHVGHEVDLDQATTTLKEIIGQDERILEDPPATIRTHRITDYSVEFVVRPWARTEDYWPVYWDLTKAIKVRLDAEGIAIPHPKRDVFLHQPS